MPCVLHLRICRLPHPEGSFPLIAMLLRRSRGAWSRSGARFVHRPSYAKEYRRSLAKPEEFWAEAAQDIEWFSPFTKTLDEYVAAVWGVFGRLD